MFDAYSDARTAFTSSVKKIFLIKKFKFLSISRNTKVIHLFISTIVTIAMCNSTKLKTK